MTSVLNTFIAMLRVEIALEVVMSRLLTFASCPNVNVPPVWGQVNGAAGAGAAPNAIVQRTPIQVAPACFMNVLPPLGQIC